MLIQFRASQWIASQVLFACLAGSLLLKAGPPQGWMLAGSNRSNYQSEVDDSASYNGHPSVYMKAVKPDAEGFGTLMQQFSAEQYRGARIRLTAFVKSDKVANWAGLWMRVDKGMVPVSFDNMQDRAIKGSSDWTSYSVVLDVPKDATGIAFGILLAGGGTVWLNNAQFEVVGNDVPVTGKQQQPSPEPTNLNFEKREK